MNESTVARTPGGETALTGWPLLAARSDVAAAPREPGQTARGLVGADRVAVGPGGATASTYAKFSFNEKTGAVSIRIVDARTEEVIREIPPERVAEIAEELQALARRTAPGGRAADDGVIGLPSSPDRGVDRYV